MLWQRFDVEKKSSKNPLILLVKPGFIYFDKQQSLREGQSSITQLDGGSAEAEPGSEAVGREEVGRVNSSSNQSEL